MSRSTDKLHLVALVLALLLGPVAFAAPAEQPMVQGSPEAGPTLDEARDETPLPAEATALEEDLAGADSVPPAEEAASPDDARGVLGTGLELLPDVPFEVGSPCCTTLCEQICGVGEPCACMRCQVLGCGL